SAYVERQRGIARLRVGAHLCVGIVERDDGAGAEAAEGHQVAALCSSDRVVAVWIGDHALHHARARDPVGVVTITEIGVAEEPAHAEAAIGADLPTVAADTCVARAELGLGPAVVASHPDQSARHSILGANRTPNTSHFKGAC